MKILHTLNTKIKKIRYIIWGLKLYYFADVKNYNFFLRALKDDFLTLLGLTRLKGIFLSPSHQCNANCPHCYEKFQFKDAEKALSTDECKKLIDQFKKLGGCLVYFCSGEFLMRPDAIELVEYCNQNKIATSITTNGLIIDEKKIIELKRAGLTLLVFSIDSADPKKHDALRGTGAFDKAVAGLKLAKKHKIRTQIWTYMTKSHKDELDGIANLGREVGVDFVHVFFTLLSGNLFYNFEENFTPDEREKIRKKYIGLYPIFFEFSGEDWYCKGGGRDFLNIMPTGDATYCPPIPYSYGNVKNESLKDVLIRMRKDYGKLKHCARSQCPINYPEYREKCNAKFIYPERTEV